jgi:predicted TPR repeat methyltransferase
MFGLMYDLVGPGDILLDVGIGTGSSSILFQKAGLTVWGMDNSEEMLEACASKGFVSDLKMHDLGKIPWPYPADGCDHVVSLGVLNHFGDLDPVFGEVARITRRGGMVGFTVERQETGQGEHYRVWGGEGTEGQSAAKEEDGDVHFRHSDAYIEGLLAEVGIEVVRKLVFVAGRRETTGEEVFFNAYVGRME